MKVTTISKKLIKPQTRTSQNLKNCSLSFLDQYMMSMNILMALFYRSKPHNAAHLLQESLSKILVKFYPLAGRYTKNDSFIDCSDQGAIFVEAEALDVNLTTVKNTTDFNELNNLFSKQDLSSHAANPLLSIQVTHFPCGGMVIGIAVSHMVLDGPSLETFITAWSNATNPNGKISVTPSFDLPSLLPYKHRNFKPTSKQENMAVKRLLFDNLSLMRLKSKLKPTSRVRVVCAVIARALIRLDRAKHGKTRDFAIVQQINMRGKTTTPLPKHICGNLILPSMTPTMVGDEEMGLQELFDMMGDTIAKSIDDHRDIMSHDRDGRDIIITTGKKYVKELMNPKTNVMCFADCTKFGFYEADFGWGKPVWVVLLPTDGYTRLTGTGEGDGIEVLVYLDKDDMHYFEQDEDIKSIKKRSSL